MIGKLSVTSRGSIHISRVFHTRALEEARTTHVASEDKDQSNAFEGNETNIQPAYCQQASTSN